MYESFARNFSCVSHELVKMSYIHQALQDITMTATSHQLASEHYLSYSQAIKYPMAIGPVMVMIVSFVGSLMGGDYFYYANEILSLISLLSVAIDTYFGWSKLYVSNANLAAQYFDLRDKLNRLKRQQQVRAQDVQGAVEKIEENFMVLLHKHRRPPSTYQQKALEVMKSTQTLVEAIDKRRHSDSRCDKFDRTPSLPNQPQPHHVRNSSAHAAKILGIDPETNLKLKLSEAKITINE